MAGKPRRRLRVWRAEKEITQGQLMLRVRKLLPAGRTMSQSRYSQIENGEGASPDRTEREAVAAALDIRVSDIEWPEDTLPAVERTA